MDPFTLTEKLFVSTYAVEICKQLHRIDIDQCCGCKLTERLECLMLTEDEKIEINFQEALRNVNFESANRMVLDNLAPFQLSARTKTGLYQWLNSKPALNRDICEKIKQVVKVIRMY